VNGSDESPVFSFLKSSSDCGDMKWNFEKFLVNKDATSVTHYGTRVSPSEMDADIAALLSE